MSKSLFVFLFSALIFAFPDRAHSWGHKGHTIIAEGAYAMLTVQQQTKLYNILQDADMAVSNSTHSVANPVTIDEAASWMDAVRRYYSEYKNMVNWHYSNQDNPLPGDNVVDAINNAISKLKTGGLTAKETKLNFLILLHLVGDIHQPLHCGYKSDLGGNTIKVSCSVCKGSGDTNLHHVWDDEIITYNKLSVATVKNKIKTMNLEAIENSSVSDWCDESFEIVKDKKCYPAGDVVDAAYLVKYGPVVEEQLAKATIRLYKVLNELL